MTKSQKTKKSCKKKNINFLKLDIDKQVQLVNDALTDEVYPALMQDGGGLEIMDIEGLDVLIRYYGACAGCPAATTGTLVFIEETLKDKVDQNIRVKIV